MHDVVYFEDVYKAYNNKMALRGASFTIPRGAVSGLLGPNGSGKTTSLKLALGLLKPSRGAVLVLGEDPWSKPGVRASIGYLPESPIYPRDARVSTLLHHIARLKGASLGEAGRVAKLVGIDRLMGYPISSLSRGYLQRLGLALALLGEPELLLLDEPTANLDPRARVEILRLVRDVSSMLDATVVISSHILPELQEVVDYLVIISQGEVLDHGPVEELARRYRARMLYRVSTPNPRLLARDLIVLHYVDGVMLGEDSITVYVSSTHYRAFEARLEELAGEGLVEEYRVETGLLGEIYEAAVSG